MIFSLKKNLFSAQLVHLQSEDGCIPFTSDTVFYFVLLGGLKEKNKSVCMCLSSFLSLPLKSVAGGLWFLCWSPSLLSKKGNHVLIHCDWDAAWDW